MSFCGEQRRGPHSTGLPAALPSPGVVGRNVGFRSQTDFGSPTLLDGQVCQTKAGSKTAPSTLKLSVPCAFGSVTFVSMAMLAALDLGCVRLRSGAHTPGFTGIDVLVSSEVPWTCFVARVGTFFVIFSVSELSGVVGNCHDLLVVIVLPLAKRADLFNLTKR